MIKRILLFLILIFQLSSCSNDVTYVQQDDGIHHLIDFKRFTITVPVDFKYHCLQGIDSFIGEIKNEKSIFFFDYGWYSPSPPVSESQFIEDIKLRERMDFRSTLLFNNLIDLTPFENEDGSITVGSVGKKVKVVGFDTITTEVKLDIGKEKNCEFYYTVIYEDEVYKIPFCFTEEEKEMFNGYTLTIDTLGNYKRTIALWDSKVNAVTSKNGTSSVHFENLDKDPSISKLSIVVNPNHEFSDNELKTIFKSVRMKNRAE